MKHSLSEKLAKFIQNFDSIKLPQEVYFETKKRIIDTVGCAISAKHLCNTLSLEYTIEKIFSKGDSTLIGKEEKGSAMSAALYNAFLAHSLELDDSLPAVGHIGAVIIPVAFAVGEETRSTGEELIRSIVLGYEIFSRIGNYSLRGHLQNRGFHPTGINGVFGATATASYLRRLNSEKITNALGLAGGFSSGLLEAVNDGSSSKRLNPGMAAMNGIMATYLAENGFSGPRTILEGRLGFYNAYVGTAKESDEILKSLGKEFLITRSKFKPFASCKIIHPAIDTILSMLDGHDFQVQDINDITVHMQHNGMPLVASLDKKHPTNQVQAQFSIYYMVAYTLIHKRPPLLDSISESSYHEHEVLEMADKVQVIEDSELEPKGDNSDLNRRCIIDIRFKNGTKISKTSKDDFDSMSIGDVLEKFHSITSGALSPEESKEFLDKMLNIEKSKNLGKILELNFS